MPKPPDVMLEAAVSAQKKARISAAGWGRVKRGQTIEQVVSLLDATPSVDVYGAAQIHNFYDQGFYLSFSSNGRLSAVFFINGGDEGDGFSRVRRVPKMVSALLGQSPSVLLKHCTKIRSEDATAAMNRLAATMAGDGSDTTGKVVQIA